MPPSEVRTRLPPGPRAPRAIQTYHWLRHPTALFERCAARYGDLFTLRLVGLGDHVYVSDPAVVRQVFTGDSALYHAGEAYRPLMEPGGGAWSIFVLDDEDHLRMRRLLLPPFHGERIRRWVPLITQLTEDEIARWPAGKPFRLRPVTERITFEVIMQLVFGLRDPERGPELRRLLARLFKVGPLQALAFLLPSLRIDRPWMPWGKYEELRRRIWGLLGEEVRERRTELERSSAQEGEERDDILSMLIAARDEDGNGLTDSQLCDQLVTMLLAGHETTASALTWAFERLLRHPEVLARLQEEVDAGASTEYLDAVIDETLRIRPVGAHVARKLTREVEIKGYSIPARRVLAIAIYLIHHSPELYDEPYRFRPERFLEAKPESYAWIPFGGGVRRCLGAGLAQLEMQVVISTILRHSRLRASRPEPERLEVLGVTIVPSRGGEVVLDGWRRPRDREQVVSVW
jgi:cytochrome P450